MSSSDITLRPSGGLLTVAGQAALDPLAGGEVCAAHRAGLHNCEKKDISTVKNWR